jgi:hypothetical protein
MIDLMVKFKLIYLILGLVAVAVGLLYFFWQRNIISIRKPPIEYTESQEDIDAMLTNFPTIFLGQPSPPEMYCEEGGFRYVEGVEVPTSDNCAVCTCTSGRVWCKRNLEKCPDE